MKMCFKISLLLSLLILFASCRKIEVEKNDLPQGYADSQVVGEWTITAVSSDAPYDWNGDGIPETDIYSTWSDCNRDNLYILDGTKTGLYQISCSITRPGTWQMVDRHTLTLLPDGYAPTQEKIISLTSDEFITESVVVAASNEIFKVKKTWTRK